MVRAERIAHLIKRMENGYKLTTDDVNRFYNHVLNSVVDLRSSQRDFKDVQDFDPRVRVIKTKGRKYIYIPKHSKKIVPEPPIIRSEVLSIYVLKAHLNAFKKTDLEDDVKELIGKINESNPEDIYSTESLFWDQNFGKYDYGMHSATINSVIEHIVNKNHVKIDYDKTTGQTQNTFKCVFRQFFEYNGSLYVAAYVPFHKNHVALKIECINKIRKVNPEDDEEIPPFDFNEFTKFRFGVFYGKIQPVVIRINKSVKHYFENRSYHETQEVFDDNGDLVIKMEVPLSPELESWLMGWIDQIEIIQPDRLRNSVISRLKAGLKNLEKEKKTRKRKESL